jgi:hypothetical protein
MLISRPVVTIVASQDGKRFTARFNNDAWGYEYSFVATFDSRKKCVAESKSFCKDYDAEASEMEASPGKRAHIMTMCLDAGIVKRRKKLSERFHRYTKDAVNEANAS